jgi:hypothetical protein
MAAPACLLIALIAPSLGCVSTGDPNDPNAAKRLVIPPIVIWSRDADKQRESRSLFGPVYRHAFDNKGDKRKRSVDVLWPLFSHRLTLESSGAGDDKYDRRTNILLGWLYSARSDNYGKGYRNIQFLWPLGQYFRGEETSTGDVRSVRSFRFLPFVQYKRSWRPVDPRRESSMDLFSLEHEEKKTAAVTDLRHDERMHFRLLHVLFGLERDHEVSRQFLVGGVPKSDDGSKTTFGFWAHETGPSADFEHQLLWRAILFKRSGSREIISQTGNMDKPSDYWRSFQWMWHGPPRTLVRMGPVFSYASDWLADTRRFSVLFGFFSVARDGPERRGRVFWFIPWKLRPKRKP